MDQLCICFGREAKGEPISISVTQDNAELCEILADSKQLVIDLKNAIEGASGIPASQQRLLSTRKAPLFDGVHLGNCFEGASAARVSLIREIDLLICEQLHWADLKSPLLVNIKRLESWYASHKTVQLNVLPKENLNLALSVIIGTLTKGQASIPVLSLVRSDITHCVVHVEPLTERSKQFQVFNGNFEFWGNAVPTGPNKYDVLRLGAHVLTIASNARLDEIYVMSPTSEVLASMSATSGEDTLKLQLRNNLDTMLMVAFLLCFSVFHVDHEN